MKWETGAQRGTTHKLTTGSVLAQCQYISIGLLDDNSIGPSLYTLNDATEEEDTTEDLVFGTNINIGISKHYGTDGVRAWLRIIWDCWTWISP